MNLKNTLRAIKHLAKIGLTPMIWGYHGVGKTSIQNTLNEEGHKFFNIRLGNMVDQGDLIGLADFLKNAEGQVIATKFAIHEWMRELIEFCKENPNKYGVMIFDEWNQVQDPSLHAPLFQMVLDKRLHTHVFPENLIFVMMSNPPTSDYGGLQSPENKALFDRFAHIWCDPSTDEWLAYAEKKGLHKSIVSLIRSEPIHLRPTNLQPFDVSLFVDNSQRTAEFVSRLVSLSDEEGLYENDRDYLTELLNGIIRQESVVSLYKIIEDQKRLHISGEDVIKNPKDAALKAKIKEALKGNHTDVLHQTNSEIIGILRKDLVDNKYESVEDYVKLIPPSVGYSLVKSLAVDEDIIRIINEVKTGEDKAKIARVDGFMNMIMNLSKNIKVV